MTCPFPRPARLAVPARWLLATVALVAVAALAACTPHRRLYPKLEGLARAGQYEAAAKLVEESQEAYGDRNSVLYDLDRGVFYHYAGKYKESNEAFERAERRIDELFTESITGNVAAFALNDNTLPYRGEDFESVIINVYRALNYIQLGDVQAALVEARKVNLKLEQINRQYEPGKKNVYSEDAFARLLAGVLYEMGGARDDLNDAYISNKLAANSYEKNFRANYGVGAPSPLGSNLLTTASFMGPEELNGAKAQFPGQVLIPLREKQSSAQLYFIHFAGKGPTKVEDAIRVVMPDGNLIKVAFPRYKPNFYLITGSRVRIDGERATTLEPAQPIGAIAVQNLDNRKGRIAVKAIARATTKYLASRALQREAGKRSEGAALLAWVAGTVFSEISEQADLRSWETLPDRVLIGRVLLPAGRHAIEVELTTSAGATVATRDLGEVELRAGQTRFFILHTLN